MSFLKTVQKTDEYAAIAEFYGDRRAERSQVLLLNHIDEGIAIIDEYDRITQQSVFIMKHFNKLMAARAYCLHPLFQNDQELCLQGFAYSMRKTANAHAVMLTMEYRQRANAWLSDKVSVRMVPKFPAAPGPIEEEPLYRLDGLPDAGPIPEVVAMLVADKVQNFKDFVLHHQGKHTRSEELTRYFKTWVGALGLSGDDLLRLGDAARAVHHG